MSDHARFRALGFALAWLASSAFAAGPDPMGAVAPLYARGHKALASAVSGDLSALWKRCDRLAAKTKDELGPLDFDPVTNSQLGFESLKGQALKIASQDAGHAAVDVKLQWKADVKPGPDHAASDDVVHYALVFENGAWRIDDVRSTADGKPWSLRKLLTDYAKAK